MKRRKPCLRGGRRPAGILQPNAGGRYSNLPDGTVKTPKNTSFFESRKVEPGGTLIVPPKGPKKDYLDAMAKITQIIYQIAISVGVAVTVF